MKIQFELNPNQRRALVGGLIAAAFFLIEAGVIEILLGLDQDCRRAVDRRAIVSQRGRRRYGVLAGKQKKAGRVMFDDISAPAGGNGIRRWSNLGLQRRELAARRQHRCKSTRR